MPFAQHLLLTIYYALLAVVTAVMLYRGFLILRYYRRPKGDESPERRFDEEPVVTVQLPIFNEKFVIERLLDAVCAFDWPREKLEIQVLDDSTDDTVEVTAAKVAADLQALNDDLEKEVDALEDAYDAQDETLREIEIKAKVADIHVPMVGLAWMPYRDAGDGRLEPAWR